MAEIIDGEKLKKELKAAKTHPRNFLFAMGAEKVLLLSKSKFTGKEIAAVKTASGGTTVYRGRCWDENGVMFFGTKTNPPGTLKAAIKAAIHEHAGLSMKVEVRQLGENESDEVDEGTAVPASDTSPAPGPGVAPAPAAQQPEANPANASLYQQQRTHLLPRYEQAVQARPEQKPLLERLLNQMEASAQAGDYAAALTHLKRLAKGIVAVMQASANQAGAAPAAPTAPPAPPPTPPPARTATPTAVPRVAPATGSNVLYTQSILVWDGARKKAAAELDKLQKAVLADPEVKAHPQFNEIVAAVGKFSDELVPFDGKLRDALDEAYVATNPAERTAARGKALRILQGYRGVLEGSAVLRKLDQSPYVSVQVFATLSNTLTVLEGKLAATA